MMKIYQLILLICALIVRLSAFTDPSVLNPQLLKRFEYKLSFKGPNLTFKDGTIPFWSFGGSAIASDDQIRITPSIHSQKGWLWSKNSMTADNWLLDVKLRITGRGRLGADGMAIWFTEQTGVEGPVFGSNDNWKGLGIFLDSFDNDALQNNPILAVMVNDGTKSYDHQHDGSGQIQGSCIRDFRNKPLPIRVKIEYVNQALTVYINNGISQDDNAFEFCTRLDNIQLPKSGYLGVTAATGGLADDHDVLEFITNTFTDRQASGVNQAAAVEEARKYKEEYEKYEQELKKQQEDYKKEHPDLTTPINEQALYESEYDREFRTILEGQDQIRNSLTNIDRKMAELLGRVERLAITGGNQQPAASGGSQGGVPADVARVQDVNRVINSNTEITRTIQSYAQVLPRRAPPPRRLSPLATMSGLTPEASRLYRVRKTVVKMLHNRGYIVSDNEMVMTPESFQGQFGDNPTREMMTILVEKIDDPSDNLFVFFPEDTKVGVKPIRNYCNRMKDENVTKAILVVQEGITPFARQALTEMAPRYKIEHFKETELLVDITEHTLVPIHRVLSRDEKAALLKRYRIKDSQLPRMQVSDPIARYYGMTRGQVVKIIRPSETAGRYVTYRAVM